VGLKVVARKEYILSNLILIFVVLTGFSRAANDVSNAVALLVPYFSETLWPNPAFLIGAGGMAMGLIFLGRNVLKTISSDIVEITAESAISAQISTSIIITWAAFVGLPLSGTHVYISSLIGAGFVNQQRPQRKIITQITLSALLTPIISGILALSSLYLLLFITG
jgi:PiT family inorganic phosphate transporter